MAGARCSTIDTSGKARNAHAGVIGIGDKPHRLPTVEAVLNGSTIDEATIAKAEPPRLQRSSRRTTSMSAAYRRSLVGTMVERARKSAAAQ
jgi:carbon-monoxide dehydrogenase medium subunit